MIRRALDSIVETFLPHRALARLQARVTIEQIHAITGGDGSGYDAAARNRLTKFGAGGADTENALPPEQIERLAFFSWKLYRNVPHAGKIVRSLESKIVGAGNEPQSLATLGGKPADEFRERAESLWRAISGRIDVRGTPGKGGQSLEMIQRSLIRNTVLSGEAFLKFVQPSDEQVEELDLPIPLQIQMIQPRRLMNDVAGNDRVFRGVEFDENGRRVAYHLNDFSPTGVIRLAATTPVPVSEMLHLYLMTDVDQIRGTPWFHAILKKMDNVGDYEEYEMTAAKMAACVMMAIKKSSGQTENWGAQPSAGQDSLDSDGNQLSFLQPGAIVDVGVDGSIDAFDPQRPNQQAVEFLNHIGRSEAAGVPGMKASTITQDFRGSSFASERSSDNDIWPEILALQDWFNKSINQPLYDRIVQDGIIAGWFEGAVTDKEFQQNKDQLLQAQWSVPVQAAINPKDDVVAAVMRIAAGLSTPQIEAAKLGRNWDDILAALKTFIDRATDEYDIPPALIDSFLGIQNNGISVENQTAAIKAAAASAA